MDYDFIIDTAKERNEVKLVTDAVLQVASLGVTIVGSVTAAATATTTAGILWNFILAWFLIGLGCTVIRHIILRLL